MTSVNLSAQRPTGKDVAHRADVSQSTVSLVLSGKAKGRVSSEIQDRVHRAAGELGYRPAAVARALRSGRAHALGLIVPDVTNPFLGRVLRGAQETARQAGYTVALLEPGPDLAWQLESIQALETGAVDGWLLFAVDPPAGRTAQGAVVLIETQAPEFPAVVLDIAGGIDAAVGHLVQLGHRHIAHLAADLDVWTFRERAERFDAALNRAGSPDGSCGHVPSPFTLDGAHRAARHLLTSQRPTAVVCDDDLLAAGVYLAAHDLDLRVGDELSVVGFADTLPGRILRPRLTTVIAPAEQLDAVATDNLLDALCGYPTRALTVLPTQWHLGASTASPPNPDE